MREYKKIKIETEELTKVLCDICKKEVNTHIQDFTDTFNVKGISITATIKIRVCNECGAEVWDEQLENTNEKIVYKKYNELKGGAKC